MDKLKQRIAILEFCGWKRDPDFDFQTSYETVEIWSNGSKLSRFENLPDYLNDLNAIHEAEKLIVSDTEKCFAYQRALAKACGADEYDFEKSFIWHASAPERAEALLRTIGKWEES